SGKEVARFSGYQADVTALAFSPDGALLAGAFTGATVLLWPVPAAAPAPRGAAKGPPARGPGARGGRWGGGATRPGPLAPWALVEAPQEALPFLRARLRPAAAVDPRQIERWVAELDSDQFAARQAAVKRLKEADTHAEKIVDASLKGKLSPEVRRRLETILASIRELPPSNRLLALRAVLLLERIGNAEAQKLLATLASGAAADRLTQQAQASLQRLARRSPTAP